MQISIFKVNKALRQSAVAHIEEEMETFFGVVRDISSEGHGVVDHPNGRVFFVRGAWTGDEGEFAILSTEKKYGTARIVNLSKKSSARREVSCPHFGLSEGECGGCSWIYVNYPEQLKYKQKRIEHIISRFHLQNENLKLLSVKGSEKEFAYRNRAQFKTDGKMLGYVSPGTKKIAPIQSCQILTEKNQQTLKDLLAELPNETWQPRPPHLWNFIDIDEGVNAEQVVLNQRRTFLQANDAQNIFMQQWLKEKLAGENKAAPIVELFSGSGNFTKILQELCFESIFTVEVEQKALEKAKQASDVKVIGADLYRPASWKVLKEVFQTCEILILDPPRDGFPQLEKFVEPFQKLRKIIYISCEPYNWGGDVKKLVDKRWQVGEIQPVDQFPQTPHIELLSVLEK